MKITILAILIILSVGIILYITNFRSKQNPILKHNPSEYYSGNSLLLAEAIRKNDIQKLKELLQKYPEEAKSKGLKELPLTAWAIGHENPEALELLLASGAPADDYFMVTDSKRSLLSLATGAKQSDFFNILLKHKANPNGIPDTELPIFTAFYEHKNERIDELLKAGADINYKDSTGKTLVIVLALARKYTLVLEMKEKGADLHVAMTNGTSLRKIIEKFPLPSNTTEGKAQAEVLQLLETK